MSESGKINATKSIELAFRLGFGATVLDFLNSAIFEFYIRQKTHYEKNRLGHVTGQTEKLATYYAILEWVFRGMIVLISLG